MTASETDWVEKIGAPAYASIAEMVAALNCDYDRLEELRDELADEYDDQAEQNDPSDEKALLAWIANAANSAEIGGHPFRDTAAEYLELREAAGECKDQDEARERIEEDALSVEVRSGWVTPGSEMTPEDFAILLSTGGPAVRIRGELDEHNEPHRAWLEVQDWGKPWTQYFPADQDTLLAYARCFYFAQ